MYRVVLCTDDPDLSGRLYTAFRQRPDLLLTAEARPGDLLQTLAGQQPDACLVSYPLNRANGVRVAAEAAQRFPEVSVWLLTPAPTAAVREAARQASLAGVVDLRTAADGLSAGLEHHGVAPRAPGPMPGPAPGPPAPRTASDRPRGRRRRAIYAAFGVVTALAVVAAVHVALPRGVACPVVRAHLGSREATVSGRPVRWRTPPAVLGGMAYLPLRDLASAFDARVRWVPPDTAAITLPSSRTVTIHLHHARGAYIRPPGYAMVPLPLAAALFGQATRQGQEVRVSCRG